MEIGLQFKNSSERLVERGIKTMSYPSKNVQLKRKTYHSEVFSFPVIYTLLHDYGKLAKIILALDLSIRVLRCFQFNITLANLWKSKIKYTADCVFNSDFKRSFLLVSDLCRLKFSSQWQVNLPFYSKSILPVRSTGQKKSVTFW